jgi:hypothetical protein
MYIVEYINPRTGKVSEVKFKTSCQTTAERLTAKITSRSKVVKDVDGKRLIVEGSSEVVETGNQEEPNVDETV